MSVDTTTEPHPKPTQILVKHVGKSVLLHLLISKYSFRRGYEQSRCIFLTHCSRRILLSIRKLRGSQLQRGLKARVCGCSLAGVAGSNPTGDMDVCVLRVLFVRSLRQAVPSSRGALSSVVCGSVWVSHWLIIYKSNLSETGRSLVQRSPTEWCVCVCVCSSLIDHLQE